MSFAHDVLPFVYQYCIALLRLPDQSSVLDCDAIQTTSLQPHACSLVVT